jgi:hypothetical protein
MENSLARQAIRQNGKRYLLKNINKKNYDFSALSKRIEVVNNIENFPQMFLYQHKDNLYIAREFIPEPDNQIGN